MKLEQQLAEAQTRLANAQRLHQDLTGAHSAAIAQAKEAHELASKLCSDRAKEVRTVEALVGVELGILLPCMLRPDGDLTWNAVHYDEHGQVFTPEFRSAVCQWSGLRPEEEREWLSRDKNLMTNALYALACKTIASAPEVLAVHGRLKVARQERDATGKAWSAASEPVHVADSALRLAQREVDDIATKIHTRDYRKKLDNVTPAAPMPQASAADKARYIEARRRMDKPTTHHFTWTPPKS